MNKILMGRHWKKYQRTRAKSSLLPRKISALRLSQAAKKIETDKYTHTEVLLNAAVGGDGEMRGEQREQYTECKVRGPKNIFLESD